MDEDFFSAYRAALLDAARLEAEIVDLEHERKRVLAKEIVAQDTKSIGRAEELARSGDVYGAFLTRLAAKRQETGKATATAEYLRCRWETWRSLQATKRVRENT